MSLGSFVRESAKKLGAPGTWESGEGFRQGRSGEDPSQSVGYGNLARVTSRDEALTHSPGRARQLRDHHLVRHARGLANHQALRPRTERAVLPRSEPGAGGQGR